MKVVILDATGNVLESDIDDDEDNNTAATTQEVGQDTDGQNKPSPEELARTKVFNSLDATTQNYANSSADKASQIGKAWAAALAVFEKGKFKAALDAVGSKPEVSISDTSPFKYA